MKTRKIFILVFLTFALNFLTFTSSAQWQRFNFPNLKLYNTNSKYLYSVHADSTYFLRTMNDWQTWDTVFANFTILTFGADSTGNIILGKRNSDIYSYNIYKVHGNMVDSVYKIPYGYGNLSKIYINKNVIYLLTSGRFIFRSFDGANSFTPIQIIPWGNLSYIRYAEVAKDSVLYLYIESTDPPSSNHIASFNAGNTWQYISDYLYFGSYIFVSPYIFLGQNYVRRSIDGGHTFEICSPEWVVRSLSYKNGVLMAGTKNIGIYVSTNNGNTWVPFNDGLDSLCCNAYVAVTDSFYYVTLNDSITYRRSIHDLTGIATHTTEPTISLFPNPATDFLTLNIENFELLPFTFQLYNLQGSLQKEGKTSNSQTEINVATLPRGLYILKIITDKQTIMKKVVLQ